MSYRDQCDGPDLTCADDARLQREFLGHRIDTFLRSKGWKHTSSTPGSLWLWQRKLDDGRVILVQQSTAIAIQEYLESLEEP